MVKNYPYKDHLVYVVVSNGESLSARIICCKPKDGPLALEIKHGNPWNNMHNRSIFGETVSSEPGRQRPSYTPENMEI